MVRQLDAPPKPSSNVADDSVGRALLADTQDFRPDSSASKNSLSPNQSFLDIPPINAGRNGDLLAMADVTEQPKEKPTPAKLAEKSKEDASALATLMKTNFKFGDLKDGDRDDMHSAFHHQLSKSEGLAPSDRAKALRTFVDQLNTNLREGNGKYSFREDATGNANKLSFSLVDKGDGDLVAGLPKRTVYDTMEYALKKEDQVVNNMPDRESIPADLKEPFDYAHQQARESVIKTKYGPALDSVMKETKIRELASQTEINKALGLKPDATNADMFKELEKRMMAKLGQPNKDYNQEYSKDVDKAFLKTLELKPGVATTKDIEAALKKLKASVPKDFKRDVPPTP
ncbi:MAG: hypothetical protein SGJ27_02930 [Candidatus Melainabacteria bacterium]|nr:hypothetical protein [Candidatus Melainabacteria bacterium]